MENEEIKKIVKERYSRVASTGCSCCGANNDQISKEIGYSDEEIKEFSEANLGLGCGNPTALAGLKEGDVVLDLGAGAGFDCFLAAKKVGPTGKVIGVDMTEEMLELAEKNAKRYGYKNVEFRLGHIEELPVDDNSTDIIISNCVINLSPDKPKVFQEAYRVLKPGGKMYVSDIVLLGELSEEQRRNKDLIAGCVGGALLREEYLELISSSGFAVRILSEDTSLSKKQYHGLLIESLRFEAKKE